jgi:hypothetical protein
VQQNVVSLLLCDTHLSRLDVPYAFKGYFPDGAKLVPVALFKGLRLTPGPGLDVRWGPGSTTMMRRYAVYALIAYLAYQIAGVWPSKEFWIFFSVWVAGDDLAKRYLFKLPWFAYDPDELNYLERHTVNLWEHV